MSRDQIDAIVSRLSERATDLEDYAVDVGELSKEIVEGNVRRSREVLRGMQSDLAANRLSGEACIARRLVQEEGLPWEPDSTEFKRLCRRLLVSHIETLQKRLTLYGVDGASQAEAVPVDESPLLSKVIDDYLSFKHSQGKWTPKTTKQLGSIFTVMTQLLGDKPIRSYTKAGMRELYRLLPQFPVYANKRYPSLAAEDAIAAADAEGNDERLSPKSQNDYFTHIKSLWKWAVENDYLDKSPAVVLKDVEELTAWDQRPAFTDEQLRAFFEALDSEAEPAMRWIPRLMLFAGLRTEEAAKLRPEDIRTEQGVAVVDVNRATGRLKTKNADRLIPLHSAIARPLVEYAKTRRQGANLWGLTPNAAGTYSASLSKRLNTRLDNAVPDDDKLVVYSLRHTFTTRLKYAGIHPDSLDELLGHKVERLSSGRYGKQFEPQHLAPMVERLRVPVGTP